jgi:hypothetical protein
MAHSTKAYLKSYGLQFLFRFAVFRVNHVTCARAGLAAIYNRNKYEKETREAIELWGNKLRTILQ